MLFNKILFSEASALASEIEYFMSKGMDDEEFDNVIIKAGCEYYSYADNLSGKEWLQQILK